MLWEFFVVAFVIRGKAEHAPIHATIVRVIRILRPRPFITIDCQPAGVHQFSGDDGFTDASCAMFAAHDGPYSGDLIVGNQQHTCEDVGRHFEALRDLALARADGSLRSRFARLAKVDVLVVDDWAMAPLSDLERRDFLEICEDRYQTRSLVLTSQLPLAQWHAQIGDPTLADSILDRLVHNAHRIEMQGESMRKKRGGKDA
jgi:hypothetical protein